MSGLPPLGSLPVIVDRYCTTFGKVVRRTWRERLFSWPWRPCQRTRFVPPRPTAYVVKDFCGMRRVLAHPDVVDKWLAAAGDDE